MATHWMTRYDPDDGEPYGELCDCSLGDDHDAADLPDDEEDDTPTPLGEYLDLLRGVGA